MDDLVKRLSQEKTAVSAVLRPEKTGKALLEAIDRGWVHIKFTETRGGTELLVRVDPKASDLEHADFENETGTVHLVGRLTLNDEKVRCEADIDLTTFNGEGHLIPTTERGSKNG